MIVFSVAIKSIRALSCSTVSEGADIGLKTTLHIVHPVDISEDNSHG